MGARADLERIDPDRLGNILELGLAEVADGQVQPSFDLPVGVLRQADRAWPRDPFEAGGDIDAVAHQVAVAFLDHVAQVDADAEFDAALGRQPSIALDEALLHLDGATHGVNDAAELDDAAVAGALDHAATIDGDGRIDEVAPQRAHPRQDPVFIGAREA